MPVGVFAYQARNVEYQRNISIAGYGCTRHTVQSLQQRTQRLDHHLLLSDEKVHHQPNLTSAGIDYDDMARGFDIPLPIRVDSTSFAGRTMAGRVPYHQRQLPVHHIGAFQVEIEYLHHTGQRQSKGLFAQNHHQGRKYS